VELGEGCWSASDASTRKKKLKKVFLWYGSSYEKRNRRRKEVLKEDRVIRQVLLKGGKGERKSWRINGTPAEGKGPLPNLSEGGTKKKKEAGFSEGGKTKNSSK